MYCDATVISNAILRTVNLEMTLHLRCYKKFHTRNLNSRTTQYYSSINPSIGYSQHPTTPTLLHNRAMEIRVKPRGHASHMLVSHPHHPHFQEVDMERKKNPQPKVLLRTWEELLNTLSSTYQFPSFTTVKQLLEGSVGGCSLSTAWMVVWISRG